MNKKILTTIIVVAVILLAGIAYLFYSLQKEKQNTQQMVELIEMDKLEMENEYENFAQQYNEMKTQINNDSLMAQLEQEQQRTQELLEELRRTKTNDAAEIARLKKELATMRSVLKSFVAEIDSLNRLNIQLQDENIGLRQEKAEHEQRISTLTSEKASLTDKVQIASQLDATGLSVSALNKKGKTAKKIKDLKKFQLSFTIARNVTAETGQKTIYVRILKPTNDALEGGGSFTYENRTLPYSIKKVIEYDGEEVPVTVYWDVNEMLIAGTYKFMIFADGNNIGTTSYTFEQ